jgi:CubicO group peptidase (beta-lactamase class C family)
LNNQEKEKMTIAHVLAMSSGFPWDESSYPYDDNRNDVNRFINHYDPMRFILGRNLIASPGLAFLYNSGDTNVLGEIVRKTSELVLTDFAKRYLFTPLRISSFQWMRLPFTHEVTFASGGLYLLPRDMAKIGQLYSQEGIWNGNRIISTEWIRESTKKSIDLHAYMRVPYHAYGYGYQWWLENYHSGSGTIDAYSARGWGNQFIVVLKQLNMVVVFTGVLMKQTHQSCFLTLFRIIFCLLWIEFFVE